MTRDGVLVHLTEQEAWMVMAVLHDCAHRQRCIGQNRVAGQTASTADKVERAYERALSDGEDGDR